MFTTLTLFSLPLDILSSNITRKISPPSANINFMGWTGTVNVFIMVLLLREIREPLFMAYNVTYVIFCRSSCIVRLNLVVMFFGSHLSVSILKVGFSKEWLK